ncbi:hypothetical protein FKO01_09045 [Mesorhizobium sp. B2-3-3]|nr:hypothetical protein FKO01_09045 [Mesorhizobium sp. B2-3-3]
MIVSFRRGAEAYKITPEQYDFVKRRFYREYWTAILTTIPLGGLFLLWWGGYLATHWLWLVAIIYVMGNTALNIARFRAIAQVKRFSSISSVPVEFPGMSDVKAILLKAWRSVSDIHLVNGARLTGLFFFSGVIVLVAGLLGLDNDGPRPESDSLALLFFTIVTGVLFLTFLKERRRRKESAQSAQS